MKTREEAERIVCARGWLTHMPDAFRNEVLRRSTLKHYDPRQPVFRQGDETGGMYGMVEGSLIISLAANVSGPYAASFARPGDWLGEGPAVMDQPRYVSATARATTSLFQLPLSAIREIATATPLFWRYLAINVTLNLKTVIQRYDDLLIPDARRRVAAVLLRLSGYDEVGSPYADPEILMTQSEVAEITRLTRNGLAGVLERLGGLVTVGYGHITITDAKALTRLVREGQDG